MEKKLIKYKSLLKRNIKVYFADNLVFFMSLMAPMVLLLLFALFLRGVYVSSLQSMLPEGFEFMQKNLTDAFVASWLMSSLMSVSCVTVSIGACIIMVQDKITGVINDIEASPVKKGTVSLSYFAATFCSAFIIMLIILVLGFGYIAIVGWYLSFIDIILILLTTVLLTLFGCALAVIISSFVKSDGGITAVSALSSSVYGFICGAYMPLSQFGVVFSNIFGFNPGLYGTLLLKNFYLRSITDKMGEQLPIEAVQGIKEGFDMSFTFFGMEVSMTTMWLVLGLSVLVLGGIVVLIANRKNLFKKAKVQSKVAN